jgi:hypothetical protein
MRVGVSLGLLALVGRSAAAQGGWMAWEEREVAAAAKAQPGWATPLVTISPKVEQGFRTDFVRQSVSGGKTTWNYGNTKGLQIVPWRRLEVRFSPPPFISHSNPKVEDGFGDVAFRAKYRFYGSSEAQHNAVVTAELGASVPTGKSGNGSCCAILTPTLEAGKGIGRLDVLASAGGSLPVSNAVGLGRQVVLNEAFQYHATGFRATRLLWVETEFNTTMYRGGKNDGREQTFATPGVIVSRMQLRHDAAGGEKLALTLAAGEQIALTHFNTYNHSPIFSARLRF